MQPAGPVQLLSFSPQFDALFPEGAHGEVILAEGNQTELPLRWLEGPTWFPTEQVRGNAVGPSAARAEPQIGLQGGSSVLVSDVVGNRIWRWCEADGRAEIFREPSGRATQSDDHDGM